MEKILEQCKEQFQKNPVFVVALFVGLIFLCWVFFMGFKTDEKAKQADVADSNKTAFGISVGDSEKLEFMKGLQKNFYDFEDKYKSVEAQVRSLKSAIAENKKEKQELMQVLNSLKEDMANQKRLDEKTDSNFELAVARIEHASNDDVYLPIGSFCKGTLLTGVYASTDINSPLPVLISLDEAFYGPNNTRIPLKSAFLLGKAYGDINSQRALIQIVAISLVLPDGNVFEHEQDIGYVTDEAGELGLRGQIIRNTAKALGLSFAGGFMAGGSSALADNEVTSTENIFGQRQRNITGDAGKHAIFSGFAKSSSELSKYFEKEAENIIPAVHVPSGRSVYFIIQKGVKINGLSRSAFNNLSAIN